MAPSGEDKMSEVDIRVFHSLMGSNVPFQHIDTNKITDLVLQFRL